MVIEDRMNNKKYLIYTLVTILLMVLMVTGAYNMSSKKMNDKAVTEEQAEQTETVNEENISDDVFSDDDRDKSDYTEEKEENIIEPPIVKDHIDSSVSELQPISEDGVSKSFDFNNKLVEAMNAKQNAEYSKAIELYNILLDNSSNNLSIKALCYENLAEIYAVQKRYGTAIINAQKAYSTEPTALRKFLLAKIYYKAGETEKAKQLMNAALESVF